jgi:pilus assembly protein CpaB
MRGRFSIILIIAVVAGLLASVLVYRTVAQMRAAAARGPEVEDILVAAAPIDLAQPVTARQVKLVPWPKLALPAGALRKISDAEGRVLRQAVVPGEPILESKLAAAGMGRGGVLAMLVPEGQRGVTIKVDDAVREAGFLVPNSHVDLLVTTHKENSERVAKVVLQDVVVLAAGQTVEMRDSKPVSVTNVTLALSPEQTERLMLAQSEGRIVLATRNYNDKALVKTAGATRRDLLGESAPAPVTRVVAAKPASAPAPAPAPVVAAALPPPKLETHTVTVLRAGKLAEEHLFVRGDRAQAWTEQNPREGKKP